MASVVDNETLQAVREKWLANAASLPEVLPNPPEAGRLKTPQPECYAQLESKLERREKASNLGAWWDYRRVVITVRGKKGQVVEALGAVRDVFNDSMTLSYSSTSSETGIPRFMRWIPDQGDRLEQEEAGQGKKAGEDVWRGVVEGVVWSVRTE